MTTPVSSQSAAPAATEANEPVSTKISPEQQANLDKIKEITDNYPFSANEQAEERDLYLGNTTAQAKHHFNSRRRTRGDSSVVEESKSNKPPGSKGAAESLYRKRFLKTNKYIQSGNK